MGSLLRLDKAGEVLNKLSIFSDDQNKDAQVYSKLFKKWESIVGKKLAGYSRIKDLDRNSLIVEVEHPAIMQLLQIQYRQTLNRLKFKYPELKITDIRIIVKNEEYDIKMENIQKNTRIDLHEIEHSKKNELNLDKIENENFKDLLLKMKKRSQV